MKNDNNFYEENEQDEYESFDDMYENDPKVYVAIDSKILRAFAWVEQVLANGMDTSSLANCMRGYDFVKVYDSEIKEVLEYIHEDKARFYISRTVYMENMELINDTKNPVSYFVRKYCYFPDTASASYQESKELSRELASIYSNPVFVRQNRQFYTAIDPIYCEEIGEYVPSNAAHKMAQATTAGCPYFLTNDPTDYIFDREIDSNDDFGSRRKAIIQINRDNGYGGYIDGNDGYPHYASTRPVTIMALKNALFKIFSYDYATIEPNFELKKDYEIDLSEI